MQPSHKEKSSVIFMGVNFAKCARSHLLVGTVCGFLHGHDHPIQDMAYPRAFMA
ncbi:MAG TPA: hypothetical protein VL357_02980 [Rariglobus sp.]|jgi:hypothetical protein|nr:hypothetical protein [Rariglobus sp.]